MYPALKKRRFWLCVANLNDEKSSEFTPDLSIGDTAAVLKSRPEIREIRTSGRLFKVIANTQRKSMAVQITFHGVSAAVFG